MSAKIAREVKLIRVAGSSVALALTFAFTSSLSATAETSLPPLQVIVSRMAEARAQNQARLRSYVVTREYTLFGKDEQRKRTEVTAEISFKPPGSKQYEIIHTEGSGIGERIVRKMLDGETQIVKDYSATDISEYNYDFQLLGEDESLGIRCYRLGLIPKRAEKTLLRGTIWVDVNSYLLRRMEAAPAKSPSWWLRDVELIFSYEDVEGLWLQTASQFTTNVRLFGHHTMNSRDVRYVFALPPEMNSERRDSTPVAERENRDQARGASIRNDLGSDVVEP